MTKDTAAVYREELAIIVSLGKSKEVIGVFTHDQLKRLSDKDVKKYFKKLEAFLQTNNTKRHRERLAILVALGKSKEVIGVELTHDQLELLSEKDVKKYYQKYKAFLLAYNMKYQRNL